MQTSANFPASAERIAAILGAPASSVAANWPLIEQALAAVGQASPQGCIAALATVGVECGGKFAPIHEYGRRDYFIRHYDGRRDLGNLHPGDGYRYAGRGFIQITGELNYEHYGKLLGVDLLDDPADPADDADPDKALEPHIAAAILAAFFAEHKIRELADSEQWTRIRKRINGGTNGLELFLHYVDGLKAELAAPEPEGMAPDPSSDIVECA